MASDQDLPEGSVQNILDQDTLKWVFVGGKGGVGKTTCSSILARVRASVIIISTDPAHNLSDVFQQRFTKTPTLVTGFTNLYAMEVDPTLENEDLPGAVNLVSELANAIPGIDEAMSFAEMLKLVQTMDYSVIVFDTAPTGHTLHLLQFPSTLEKGLAKLMTMKNKFGGLLSQMTGLFGVEDDFGEDAILGRLEGMKGVIEPVNRQLKGSKNWNHFMADRCCILRFLRFLLICGVFLAPVSCSSSECSKDTSMAGFQSDFVMLQHQLRGVFTVLDNCSFRVSEFDMLEGSDVRWWGAVGDNFVNLTNGFVISDDKLNRTYKNDTLVVSLNINVSWDQTKVVSVWDLSMAADFGHVLLHDPSNSSGSPEPAAAPSPDPSSVEKRGYEQPTMFENCKVLSPEYRVRWTLLKEENLVEIGLEVATVVQNYMAFGWANPNSTSGYMLFSDVTIAGFTEEDLKPFAEDYYISDYSECTLVSGQARGVCPDSIYVGSDNSDVNNTELVYGHRKDGISFVRFRRPLVSSDKKFDLAVNHTANMTVIWAIGKIKTPDSIRPFYLPQNHGGPRQVTYGYRQLNISEHVNDCLGPLDAADKLDQDLIIADAKVPLVVTTGPTSRYPNPPNPSKVLYINKKEAPLLRVERGVEVKFSVQAGHDVALYITSDIIGGNATVRNASETVYAGGAEFEGVLASPKEMLWTPDRNTPDQVFYQSLFQPKMGWKVQVVDGGLGDMYNNSVVLDDQQVNFFWTLSEDSISIAARGEKRSGYLAIGFGSGMVNSFAYVGWIDEKGKGHISTYYINGKDSSNIHPTKENLTYVRVKSENGIITLEFTRPMKPSCRIGERPECSNIVEPTTPLKIVWAMGTKWSEDHLSEKNMHSSTSSHAVRVMLIRGSAEAEQDLRPVLGVHGFMMFLAWGILLPGGAFAARYLKHVKDDGWYRFHVYLQYSGLSIVLLGFLFAVAELRGLYISSLHVRFGMAAIVLACAQPINANFRPKKPDDGEAPSLKRLFWEYFHVNLGRCAIIVGAVALFTGMKHLGDRYGEDVGGLTWALALWFLIGVLSGLFLEFREKTRKNSGTARGNWVLGNSDEDDSTDLLGSNGIHGVKEAQLSERGELQLEPLNR